MVILRERRVRQPLAHVEDALRRALRAGGAVVREALPEFIEERVAGADLEEDGEPRER